MKRTEPAANHEERSMRCRCIKRVHKGAALFGAGAAFLVLVILLALVLSALHTLKREAAQALSAAEERNQEAQALLEALLEERLTEQLRESEARLTLLLEASSEEILAAVAGNRRQVGALNAVYGDLLTAQKRRTLEGLYEEDALAARQQEAATAFAEGRYVTASKLYGELAAAHREDQESRFFQYYALFLSGRQNRDQYRAIKDAFMLLERQGYTRRELSETLAFIDAETGGAAGRGAP